MSLTGSVYGTVYYGESKYGRPLNAGNVPLPTYNAGPATAQALNYVSVKISWHIPSAGAQIRLVRNGYSQPADQNDGLVLVQQPLTSVPMFVDTTLSTVSGGKLLYYTLWNVDGIGNWWRAADMNTILPNQWGYGVRLANLLPEYYMDADDAQDSSSQPSVTTLQPTFATGTVSTWGALNP